MDYDELTKQLDALREAQRLRPRPVRVCEAVQGMVDRGRQHLRAWENVRLLVQGDDASLAELAASFFLLTAIAHLEAAALYAAKVTDRHRDSISVIYLLNVLSEDGPSLFHADWREINRIVLWGHTQIREAQPLLDEIKAKRDQDLAHFDRVYVNTGKDDPDAIEVTKLHQVFDVVFEILQRLRATSRIFDQVGRPLSEVAQDYLGTEGLEDLIHFTRAGFDNEFVKSPSQNAERARKWERALRQARDHRITTR
jgi:hypothetical protein